MTSFINEIFSPINVHATFLLLLVLLYWLMVIFGAVGMESLDLDLDIDADLDGDIDIDAGDGLFASLLAFFHVGQVPAILLLSFFALFFWLATVISNHYINTDQNWWHAALGLLPCVIVSMIVTKLTLLSLSPLFPKEKPPTDRSVNLTGKKAEVHSRHLDEDFGEIILKQEGPKVVLNAISTKGQRLQKGDTVKILSVDEKDRCIVELAKWEKEEE